MKRLNIARKFYPRLRYIRINISRLLAALLQIGVLQSSMVQGTALPVVMASLVGVTGAAHAATSSGAVISQGTRELSNGDTYTDTVVMTDGVLVISKGGKTSNTQLLGTEEIWDGGSAINTKMWNRGDQLVYTGGAAISAQVSQGGTDDNNQVWFSPSPYAHIGRNSGQGSVRDSAYEQKGGGIAFGIDKAITTERRIGAAVIINNSQIDGKDHNLKSSINNTGVDLAVYGHQSLQDDLTLSVIAKSGYTRAKSSRIDDTELPMRAKSSQDIWHLNLAAELVKTIVKEQLTLSPVLGLEYGSAWVSGYQESGAGYYSLNTERQQAQSLIASVGSRVRYQLNDKAQLLGYASVGYDALARASHLRASTEDHRFSVSSADPGNIVTRLGLAYEWRAKAGNYLRANYDYQGRDKGYRDNMLRLDWIVVW